MRIGDRALALAFVAAGMGVVMPSAHSAPVSQTATATDGTYAFGSSGPTTFADGRARDFTAIFAVPAGTVAGSPATGVADLTKPWAAVSVKGDGGTGGLAGQPELCHQFVNPAAWSAGGGGGRNGLGQSTYGGVSFTVSCPGDPTYAAFRLAFDPAPGAGGRPMGMHEYQRPEADTQLWGWSLPNAANGALKANRRNVQAARIVVCAQRHTGEQECLANPGSVAMIVPSAAFSSEAYAVN